MEIIVPVFQFEIRYNHILNFSQIARNLLAPYVRLTQSIRIDKQNTVEETYFLNFEEDGYLIIVAWDRLVFKGQGNLGTFTNKNSPLSTLFFDIFKEIYDLKDFGKVQRSLFYGVSISKYTSKENLLDNFSKNNLIFNPEEFVEGSKDVAIVIESQIESASKSITFGPYWGQEDIDKRQIKPVDINLLGNIDYEGIMLEYKYVKVGSAISFDDFSKQCTDLNDTFKKIWKKL